MIYKNGAFAAFCATIGIFVAFSSSAKADCLSLCTEICFVSGVEVYPGCMSDCFSSICVAKKQSSYKLKLNQPNNNHVNFTKMNKYAVNLKRI